MSDPVQLRPQPRILEGDAAERVARALPHNVEVEQALLGALLRRPIEAYDAIASTGLEPAHFYGPEHFAIFDVIQRRIDRGRAVTPEAIFPAIEGEGGLGELGLDYLHELQDCIVTLINVGDYATTLIDLWRRRELILRLRETTDQLYDLSDLDATAAQIGEQASDAAA